MRKRYLRLAAIVFTLVYVGAICLAAFRVSSRSSAMEFMAVGEFKDLVDKANAAAILGFLDEPFRDSIRRSLEQSKSIAAVIITGPAGPEYAVEREEGYLTNSDNMPRFASRIEIVPEPLVSPLRVADTRNATLTAVRFRIIPFEMVAILRDSLLIAVIPLLIALIFLVFFSTPSRVSKEENTPLGNGDPVLPPVPQNEFNEEFDIPDIAADVTATASENTSEKPAGLYGPDGVLGWEAYLEERLEAELRRAASFEQDLVILNAEIDTNGTKAKETFKSFAEELVSFFSFRDLSFKRGSYGVVIILPNVDLDHGLRLTEEFMMKCRERGENVEFGLSARAGRLVDAGRLLIEAEGALDRARKNGKYQIMAFKPDPERYRSFVAANS